MKKTLKPKKTNITEINKVDLGLKNLDFALADVISTGNSKDIERMITGSYEILNDAVEFMKKIYDAQQPGKVVARMEI